MVNYIGLLNKVKLSNMKCKYQKTIDCPYIKPWSDYKPCKECEHYVKESPGCLSRSIAVATIIIAIIGFSSPIVLFILALIFDHH
jgi:hypothetical protein